MSIFTDEEVMDLIRALGRGQETFTGADATRLIQWAEEQRLSYAIVENLLRGDFVVSIDSTGEPHFELSKQGVKSAERLTNPKRAKGAA